MLKDKIFKQGIGIKQLLHHKWVANSTKIQKARIELLVQGLIMSHLSACPCTLTTAKKTPWAFFTASKQPLIPGLQQALIHLIGNKLVCARVANNASGKQDSQDSYL